jgi:hypothetical protein
MSTLPPDWPRALRRLSPGYLRDLLPVIGEALAALDGSDALALARAFDALRRFEGGAFVPWALERLQKGGPGTGPEGEPQEAKKARETLIALERDWLIAAARKDLKALRAAAADLDAARPTAAPAAPPLWSLPVTLTQLAQYYTVDRRTMKGMIEKGVPHTLNLSRQSWLVDLNTVPEKVRLRLSPPERR